MGLVRSVDCIDSPPGGPFSIMIDTETGYEFFYEGEANLAHSLRSGVLRLTHKASRFTESGRHVRLMRNARRGARGPRGERRGEHQAGRISPARYANDTSWARSLRSSLPRSR